MTPRHTEWLTFNVICDDVLKSKSPTIAYTEFMTSNGCSIRFYAFALNAVDIINKCICI